MKKERVQQELVINEQKYATQYSPGEFFKVLPKLAKKGGLKAFVLATILYYTLRSPTTPFSDKAIIIVSLGYLIAPIDLIPDFVLVFGFSDDILALHLAADRIRSTLHDYVTPAILFQTIETTKQVFKKESVESIKSIINSFHLYESI